MAKISISKIVLAVVAGILALPCVNVHAQEESIQFTAPLVPKKEKVPDADPANADDAAATPAPTGPVLPVRFSMTEAEVITSVGPPVGKVKFGGKVTYYYDEGEVEFVDGVVDRFKWKGKFYTHRPMPKLAREVAGELSIKAGGGRRPAPPPGKTTVNPGGENAVDVKSSGVGRITTNSGRSASNQRKSAPQKAASALTKPTLDTKEKIKQMGLDRRHTIKEAGLEDMLLSK